MKIEVDDTVLIDTIDEKVRKVFQKVLPLWICFVVKNKLITYVPYIFSLFKFIQQLNTFSSSNYEDRNR